MTIDNQLSITYQNVRGLNTKLHKLYINSFTFNHHVIAFTETWLNKYILNNEILCSNYNIFRSDRKTDTIGGGVLIAISTEFASELINCNIPNGIEFIATSTKLLNKKMFITCSYIPPKHKNNQVVYTEHVTLIKSVVSLSDPGDLVLVLGDFNLPNVSWKFLADSYILTPTTADDWIIAFLNSFHDLCLFQINDVYNSFGKLLDLVFINEPTDCLLQRSDPIVLPEDRYHPTLDISLNVPFKTKSSSSNSQDKVFCFKKCNYDDLNHYIYNTNWIDLLSIPNNTPESIDSMISTFYETLLIFFNQCIPKTIIHNKSGPPWCTNELSRLKNIKNKRFKKYKTTGLQSDYARFAVSRAEYNLLNTNLYKNYISNIKQNFKSDPKTFYKFVNTKKKSNGFPNVMKYDDQESDDNLLISDLFTTFFPPHIRMLNIPRIYTLIQLSNTTQFIFLQFIHPK